MNTEELKYTIASTLDENREIAVFLFLALLCMFTANLWVLKHQAVPVDSPSDASFFVSMIPSAPSHVDYYVIFLLKLFIQFLMPILLMLAAVYLYAIYRGEEKILKVLPKSLNLSSAIFASGLAINIIHFISFGAYSIASATIVPLLAMAYPSIKAIGAAKRQDTKFILFAVSLFILTLMPFFLYMWRLYVAKSSYEEVLSYLWP